MSFQELILTANTKKYTVFPIEHKDLWVLYKKALANFWTPEEIDLARDYKDWETLSNNEQFFVKNVLAFFAASDGIVNENLAVNFYNEVQISEARQFYAIQIGIEAIHGETYSLLLDSYVKDHREKDALFDAIDTNPAVRLKADWALKWIDNGNFPERLLAFAAVEGIFFSGSFCAIFWLKNRGLMPGLCFSNELISRDEALHCDFAIALYSKLEKKLTQKNVFILFADAVRIEKQFITESLPVSLIGMNADLMKQYIEYVCDYYLLKLGYDRLFEAENPFPFMEYIALEGKSNFFERKNDQYSKAGVGIEPEQMIFALDEDF